MKHDPLEWDSPADTIGQEDGTGPLMYRPGLPLSRFVSVFWCQQSYVQPHSEERLLPTGTTEVVFDLSERGMLIRGGGPTTRLERYRDAVVCGPHSVGPGAAKLSAGWREGQVSPIPAQLPAVDSCPSIQGASQMKATNYKPAGFHAVTPGLRVNGAARLIDFVRNTFDGKVLDRTEHPDGRIMHVEVKIDDSIVEISDGTDRFPARPGSLHIYVPDADATYRRALSNGARSLYEPVDQSYGDREAGVEDPTGNQWFIATHAEDLTPEEMADRMAGGA